MSKTSKKAYKASEVAERFEVDSSTVRGWLRQGRFPNARLEETILGKVWLIPESDLKDFQKPMAGRPRAKKQ